MSGKLAKSQVPIISGVRLPEPARVAIILLKAEIRQGRLPREFQNASRPGRGEGSPLPRLSDGCQYVEFQVGEAHPGDPSRRGSFRLVAEVNVKAKLILEIYFTADHYTKGSFLRVV